MLQYIFCLIQFSVPKMESPMRSSSLCADYILQKCSSALRTQRLFSNIYNYVVVASVHSNECWWSNRSDASSWIADEFEKTNWTKNKHQKQFCVQQGTIQRTSIRKGRQKLNDRPFYGNAIELHRIREQYLMNLLMAKILFWQKQHKVQ